jgi:hypothetical protein
MKVAIVTTHYAINYGAVLQAYALSTFLREEFKVESEILAYWPPFYKVSWNLYLQKKDLKTMLRNVYIFFNRNARKGHKRRVENICAFMDNYLPRTEENYYSAEELISSPPQFDCYICGSDQIWNLALRDEPVFYLDFTRDMIGPKKIAYAPSITDPVPEDKVALVKKYLENIDYISVRESSDVPFFQNLTNKKVHHVVDPVYLFSADRWSEMAMKPMIKEPYILCYFSGCDNLAVKAVKRLKKITGYPVVYVNSMARDRLRSDICIRDAGPREFLGYIKSANFVCTNSFHAAAFSTIFRKDFCFIPKKTANSRMKSLQEKFVLGNRIFDAEKVANLSRDDLNVDYSKFDAAYEEFRNYSVNYLREALGV